MNPICKISTVLIACFATFAAEASLIEVSVDLDLQDLDFGSGGGFSTIIDFDDVTLDPDDRLVLDVHFVNGQIGVFSDPTAQEHPAFLLGLESPDPIFAFCCQTPTLLGTTGDLRSDTLQRFEYDLYLLDGYERASFTYSGLRLEAYFPHFSTEVSSLLFRQYFWTPGGPGPAGDSIIYRDPASVPEPGTLVLIGIGLASLGFSRRRKKVRKKTRINALLPLGSAH